MNNRKTAWYRNLGRTPDGIIDIAVDGVLAQLPPGALDEIQEHRVRSSVRAGVRRAWDVSRWGSPQ